MTPRRTAHRPDPRVAPSRRRCLPPGARWLAPRTAPSTVPVGSARHRSTFELPPSMPRTSGSRCGLALTLVRCPKRHVTARWLRLSTVTNSAPGRGSSSMMRGSAFGLGDGQPCISTIAPSPCASAPSITRRATPSGAARRPIARVDVPAHVAVTQRRQLIEHGRAAVDRAERASEPRPWIRPR